MFNLAEILMPYFSNNKRQKLLLLIQKATLISLNNKIK